VLVVVDEEESLDDVEPLDDPESELVDALLAPLSDFPFSDFAGSLAVEEPPRLSVR